jgi:hypothetical protein
MLRRNLPMSRVQILVLLGREGGKRLNLRIMADGSLGKLEGS